MTTEAEIQEISLQVKDLPGNRQAERKDLTLEPSEKAEPETS